MIEILKELNSVRLLISRKDKWKFILLFFLMVISAGLEMVGIGAISLFATFVVNPQAMSGIPLIGPLLPDTSEGLNFSAVLTNSFTLIFILLLNGTFLSLFIYIRARIVEQQRVKLATRLFSAYLTAPYELHLRRSTAELQRNVNQDTQFIIEQIIYPLLNLLLGGLLIVFITSLILLSAPPVASLSIVILGVGASGLILFFNRKIRSLGQTSKQARMDAVKTIQQGLGAYVDAQVMGANDFLNQSFYRSIQSLAYALRYFRVVSGILPYATELIAISGMMGIFCILYWLGTPIEAIIPIFALLAASLVRIRQAVSMVTGGITQIIFARANIPHIVRDLVELKVLENRSNSRSETGLITDFQDLICKNVVYKYPDSETPAIQNITLKIKKGEKVALVGSTGCGKSTLINLILGLLEPDEGSVEVNGNLVQRDLTGWHSKIGYIPQSIYLLDCSIRENVAFGLGNSEIDENAVWNALEIAQIAEFVRELPEQLDTITGERGVRLSGGQRQRIGIARALFRNPSVLIMDEATSALDNTTEKNLMAAIDCMDDEKTFIMIAHRLSTVKGCDKIFLLKNGQMESFGPYDELLQSSRTFKILASQEIH